MMTRRIFAKRLAAGMAMAAVPLRDQHKLNIDEMIVQLNTLRIQEIEMSRGEFMLFSKPTDDLFLSTREKLVRAGIRCVSYYTATIKDGHDVDRAVRFARLLGVRNISG